MNATEVIIRLRVEGPADEDVRRAMAADQTWQREVRMAVEDAMDRLDLIDASNHVARVTKPTVTFDLHVATEGGAE